MNKKTHYNLLVVDFVVYGMLLYLLLIISAVIYSDLEHESFSIRDV